MGYRERPPTRWRWKLLGEEVGQVGTKQFPGQETAEAHSSSGGTWLSPVQCLLSLGPYCFTPTHLEEPAAPWLGDIKEQIASSLVGTSLELGQACQPTAGSYDKDADAGSEAQSKAS